MTVGYLHLGPPRHGVTRFGDLLAAEGRARGALRVMEHGLELSGDTRRDRERLRQAAEALSAADVVHIQYQGQTLWGSGWTHYGNLKSFMRRCRAPLVVTLHDVYPFQGLRYAWRRLARRMGADAGQEATLSWAEAPPRRLSPGRVLGLGRRLAGSILGSDLASLWAVRLLSRRASVLQVSSREEERRLVWSTAARKRRIVPHFVERRPRLPEPDEARRRLDLEGVRTLVMQGYINEFKGYRLLVEALPELPADIRVIFLGGAAPGGEAFVEQMLALARERRVDDRLRVTGYVSEQELESYLVATDLALCPYAFVSASGSLATWISAARPILAYDMPQIRELNALVPGAIHTFAPYSPSALARAIRELLPGCGGPDPGVEKLRERLCISEVYEQHLRDYRAAARSDREA